MPGAGNPQNLNRYAFVLGNPLKYTDPTGHSPCKGHGKCGGGGSSQGATPNSSSSTHGIPQAPFVAFTTSGHVTTAEEYQWAVETAQKNRVYARYAVLPTTAHVFIGVHTMAGIGLAADGATQVDVVVNFESGEIGLTGSSQAMAGASGVRGEAGPYGGIAVVWNTSSIRAEEGPYIGAQINVRVEGPGVGAGVTGQASFADSRDPFLEAKIREQTGIAYEARPWSLSFSGEVSGGPGNINVIDGHWIFGRGITSFIGSLRLFP